MADIEIPKSYDAKTEEPTWGKFWEENKIFKFNQDTKKTIYSIDTPPPYVSAAHLHVGHAMHYSQFEFVARFKRMMGFEVFFPMGFDDNGLPTERYVEKKYKINKARTNRKEFIDLCLKETKIGIETYKKLWSELGISVDWDLIYSTIDSRCQKVSQTSFVDLFKKGRLVRKEEPIIWCTHCQTALAQAELEDKQENSFMNDIYFESEGKKLTISTTRPELLPACVALFVNPEDEKYKDIVGKKAKVPLFNHEIPIMTDSSVDPELGTGLMMVCTWGDVEDIEKWKKYDLDTRLSIDKNGVLTEIAGKYKGMKLIEARKAIIEDLENQGFLVDRKQLSHVLNVHERCGTTAEFYFIPQWFIKILDKKDELIKQAKKVKWFPEHMRLRCDNWIENLKWDWCISRERYYGVPFPVWYCEKCGEVLVAEQEDLPVDPINQKPNKKCKCGSENFKPETDVMDTWMTSSLTPLINAKWGFEDNLMDLIYPMSLRPQAHDIIRTWAFYTIIKSFYHHGSIPWKNMMISGHGQDPKGRKMSKSLGNVVFPEDIMQKYSADALRFWAATVKLGQDLPFQEKDIVTGHKMVTKLWNAFRFSLVHIKDFDPSSFSKEKLTTIDKWILSKLNNLIKTSTETFERYEYSKTKSEAEKFFWHQICDNYLEMAKGRLYQPETYGEDAKTSAQYTLYTLILTTIKLFAPIMPYITEAIYQRHFVTFENVKSIHISSWPEVDDTFSDKEAEEIGEIAVAMIVAIRKYKSDNDKALNVPVLELKIDCKEEDKAKIEKALDDIKATTKAEKVDFTKAEDVEVLGYNIKLSMVLGEAQKKK